LYRIHGIPEDPNMTRLTRSLLLASAVSAALSIAVEDTTLAQEPTPMYVVTYFEVAPAMSTEARALLKAFRDASRKEEGSVRVDALHRSERPNHFAIVEAWKSRSEERRVGKECGCRWSRSREKKRERSGEKW